MVKQYWENIGVKVNLSNVDSASIQPNFIQPREYQALLFGEEYFGNDPDPYRFWHSSEKHDPGNNIAVFSTDKLYELLTDVRKNYNPEEREAEFHEIEKIISDEVPADYLYSVNYVYVVNKKITGFDTQSLVNPIFRFNNINKWYINTKRVRK